MQLRERWIRLKMKLGLPITFRERLYVHTGPVFIYSKRKEEVKFAPFDIPCGYEKTVTQDTPGE